MSQKDPNSTHKDVNMSQEKSKMSQEVLNQPSMQEVISQISLKCAEIIKKMDEIKKKAKTPEQEKAADKLISYFSDMIKKVNTNY